MQTLILNFSLHSNSPQCLSILPVSGCPSVQADCGKAGLWGRGSSWSWSLEQSLFSPGLTWLCATSAQCAVTELQCGSIQQTLPGAGSGLTLVSLIPTCQDGYFSRKVAVNSPEHYSITCDKSLTAFLAVLQLQEKLQLIDVAELSWKLRIVCVINCVYLVWSVPMYSKSFELSMKVRELFLNQDISILQLIYR